MPFHRKVGSVAKNEEISYSGYPVYPPNPETIDMDNPFKWRHYEGEIILVCVRWYLRYSLSYRDLAEMMSERGLNIVFFYDIDRGKC